MGHGLQIIAQYDQITINPMTGSKSITYLFAVRCQLNDNLGDFLTFTANWVNDTTTSTLIKIVCNTPSFTYRNSPALLYIPLLTGVVKQTTCNAAATASGFNRTTLPVPPGTIPQEADPMDLRSRERASLGYLDYNYHRSVQLNGTGDTGMGIRPRLITHGSTLGMKHPYRHVVPQAAAVVGITFGKLLGVSFITSAITQVFNPLCWVLSCGGNSDQAAINERLDNMMSSLAALTNATTLWFDAQSAFNEQVVENQKVQNIFNQAVLKQAAATQRQVQIVKKQVNILKTTVDIIASNQVALYKAIQVELEFLQSEIQGVVTAMDDINNVTQAQISQITDWVRNLVRINRMTQATLLNIQLKTTFKTSVIAGFFAQLNATNSTYVQPYLSSSSFQAPDNSSFDEFTLIDTIVHQYTFNAGSELISSAFLTYAVSSNFLIYCRNSFLLQFPRFAIQYVDAIEWFAPENCVGVNNTCQCYWEVTTTTAVVTSAGKQVPPPIDTYEDYPRPYPYGQPPSLALSCAPFQTGLVPCDPITFQRYSDNFNEERDSEAAINFNVGAYSVMDTETAAAQTTKQTLQTAPTVFFDVERKMCLQQVNGQILYLLNITFDTTIAPGGFGNPCTVSPTALECITSGPPGNQLSQFIYGPQQNVSFRFNTPPTCAASPSTCPFNLYPKPPPFTMRISSTQLNAYWDVPSATSVGQCVFDTSTLGFANEVATGSLSQLMVDMFIMEGAINNWFGALQPDLESQVTGLMPPDLLWTEALFNPEGTVNAAGCTTFTYLNTAAPEFWEPVRSLEQVGLQVNVSVSFFDGMTKQPLKQKPVFYTSAIPQVAFPLPTNIILAGPILFNQPNSVTFDVSPRDISVSNSPVSRQNTVSYAGLPFGAYQQALLQNIPMLALWKSIFGDLWNPVAGANQLRNFLQFVTPLLPVSGIGQRCIQERRINGGWCSILDHYQVVADNETSLFIEFLPYTQWTIDIQVTLPTNEIFVETLSYCPTTQDPVVAHIVPPCLNPPCPSGANSVGFLRVTNPFNYNNQILYNIATPVGSHCPFASRVPLTIPAQGEQVIRFSPCDGVVQNLTFALPPFTACPGYYLFKADTTGFLVPGDLAPNVESSLVEVTDAVVDSISNTEAQLSSMAVQVVQLAIKGPTRAVFDRLYALSNQTLALIFAVQRNLTSQPLLTLPNELDSDYWDNLDKDFEYEREIAENATKEAEEAAQELEDNTLGLLDAQALVRNLTALLFLLNDDLQKKIEELQAALRKGCDFLDFNCNFGASLRSLLGILLIVGGCAGIGYGLYWCWKKGYFKVEESESSSSSSSSSRRRRRSIPQEPAQTYASPPPTYPPQSYPGQAYPGQPSYPGQPYPLQSYPPQAYPGQAPQPYSSPPLPGQEGYPSTGMSNSTTATANPPSDLVGNLNVQKVFANPSFPPQTPVQNAPLPTTVADSTRPATASVPLSSLAPPSSSRMGEPDEDEDEADLAWFKLTSTRRNKRHDT